MAEYHISHSVSEYRYSHLPKEPQDSLSSAGNLQNELKLVGNGTN